MDVAAGLATVTGLHISLMHLTHMPSFIRNFIQIYYILMVQNGKYFKNAGYNLSNKINFFDVDTAYF
jgi:hypothetical protein